MNPKDVKYAVAVALSKTTHRVRVAQVGLFLRTDPPDLFDRPFFKVGVTRETFWRFAEELALRLQRNVYDILPVPFDEYEQIGLYTDRLSLMLSSPLTGGAPPDESGEPRGREAKGRPTKGGPRSTAGGPRRTAPRLTRGPSDPEPKRVVNLGFADFARPDGPLATTSPLALDTEYLLWLEVGPLMKGTIEVRPEPLPTELLPARAVLKVALFSFAGELQLTPGADIGEIRLGEDGSAVVVRQPEGGRGVRATEALRGRRLFFPVRTPRTVGPARLRCNIYHEQVLVQSRLVTALVMRHPRRAARALTSVVDYALSHTLNAGLAGRRPHSLSLMINSNGGATHGFRFFGEQDFKNDVVFDGHQLQDWIGQARGAMRQAAWGDSEPWKPGKLYRYASPAKNLQRLKADLVRFAIWGYTFYDAIINQLAGGRDGDERAEAADRLTALMARPGRVQIALKQSPRFVLPAAMIYDHPFDTNADGQSYALCPEFLRAFDSAAPLEESGCFRRGCPSRDELTTVCPSGFWGFRHDLGLPLSLSSGRDVSPTLSWTGQLELTLAVSTDVAFTLRPKHEAALRSIRERLKWNYAATRTDALNALKENKALLVYFYCHGGMAKTVPFIQVGPRDEPGITRDNLRAWGVRRRDMRPLVFINGCHTAALEPDVALDFISAFVEVAGASGVIGTEITIFEPLAGAFAEECLRRFLLGAEIGEAVRGARLKLLKGGNPLGLVYIPYVISDLHISEQSGPPAG